MAERSARVAVVAGATGLVGSELVARLLREPAYHRVVALSRRPLARQDARLETANADFGRLHELLRGIAPDGRPLDAYCCLGTTIRTAKSRAGFRLIDHDYVVAFAQWARDARARRLVVVSAMGADPRSRVFYSRVKGETEKELAALGLPSLVVVRPSLLAGARAEFRPGERLALAAMRPLAALLPASVRPIAAADVAQSMIDAALADAPPPVIESAAMQGASSRAGSR